MSTETLARLSIEFRMSETMLAVRDGCLTLPLIPSTFIVRLTPVTFNFYSFHR
ncbi:hypothetical protein AGR1A_pAt20013 [Agrobacterium fabacearum CFBP 5771]|nr:hypothetical protein AGR1B_pAt20025 [Agrobacterium fabacearum S56]CVI23837.1 hypothetical protein AGR1A_pAt20013 [Agrobacterium fabacearum CFBP 5771]